MFRLWAATVKTDAHSGNAKLQMTAKHFSHKREVKLRHSLTTLTTFPLRFLARPLIKQAGQRPYFQPDFTFVHVTDIHLSERAEARRGLKSVIHRINEIAPDFVISGGDQIIDAGFADHERVRSLYHLYRESISELRAPIYHVIGNHDHFGHGQPHRYAHHDQYGKSFFLELLGQGQRYRSFKHHNWHFILLDTSHFFDHKFRGYVDSKQLEWLRNELRTALPRANIVIVTHVPLLTRLNSLVKGRVEFRLPKLVVAQAREIRRLISQYNVRLVLQGHIHTVEQLRLGKTWYVNSGAVCGRWWRGPLQHCPSGFTVVSAKNNLLHWRFEKVSHS